jgi:serine phosphatase RsbU (regulator of sigma subunit)
MAYQRERRIAESLQRSLLLMPSDQELPGLEVRPVYLAAFDEAAVGGDFYDALPLSDNEIALVIGDISGKGLAAAARTAEVKFSMRAYLRENSSPASALTRLNKFLVENRRLSKRTQAGEFFVCLCVCIINTKTGNCKLSAAGMEPAIIFKPLSNALANWDTPGIEMGGLPIGALALATYMDVEMQMDENDVLLMTTDGLTDAHPDSPTGEFFGRDGLVNVARRIIRDSSLDDIGNMLLSSARAFAGGRLKDDTCLVLARRDSSSLIA